MAGSARDARHADVERREVARFHIFDQVFDVIRGSTGFGEVELLHHARNPGGPWADGLGTARAVAPSSPHSSTHVMKGISSRWRRSGRGRGGGSISWIVVAPGA
ncbi:MAG: hypothetical protein ACLFWG_06340 [Longimicrobiales bacterium]